MSDAGSHGGASAAEVMTPLVALGPRQEDGGDDDEGGGGDSGKKVSAQQDFFFYGKMVCLACHLSVGRLLASPSPPLPFSSPTLVQGWRAGLLLSELPICIPSSEKGSIEQSNEGRDPLSLLVPPGVVLRALLSHETTVRAKHIYFFLEKKKNLCESLSC